jgi:tetratricopeptide (TPR) repeat protein
MEKVSADVASLFSEAVRCHNRGRLLTAERLYQRILASSTRHADSLHLLGVIATQKGQHERAIDLIRRAIQIQGDVAPFHANLGTCLRSLGRFAEAAESFQKAIALQEDYAEAHNNLGAALRDMGCLDQAEASFRTALRIKPKCGDAHNNLGNLLRETHRHEEALACYRRALEVTRMGHPKAATYNCNLGTALREAGQLPEAEASFRRALQIEPENPGAHNSLGVTLRDLGRFQEAELCFRRALALNPRDATVSSNLGVILKAQGHLGAAETFCRRALRIAPECADAHCALGTVLLERGQLGKAELHLERALALDPDRAVYHFNLGAVKRYTADDPQLTVLQSLQDRSANLAVEERIYVQFALAKAHEDVGDHKRSFEHLLAGNALKRQLTRYDETRTLADFEAIKEVFTPGLFQATRSAAASAAGPIFIVGMPRSGSTLVEQILASHSKVFGAGESILFPRAVKYTLGRHGYPCSIPRLSTAEFLNLGARYNIAMQAAAATGKRVTDKLLRNFLYCGLIHLALPNARIIHTRRDPVDICLSCFSKLFVGHHPYAYDLAELGRYYRGYKAMMEHWHSVLPKGVMIDVAYEDLVRDTEGQTRRILRHCGLPWEEACLSFHLSDRPVRTASAAQVRQPIYTTSVGRRRPAAELIKPLMDQLDHVTN